MSPLQVFDYRTVRRRFNRAATSYDRHAAVQQEAGRRLDERFDWLRLEPRRILDLGSGTGQLAGLMRARFPAAQVVALDIAEAMLARVPRAGRLFKRRQAVCADMHALPFAAGSFDVVVSNFSLQWSGELGAAFAEVSRVLAAGGAFAFTTLGPDSLRVCRDAWARVDRDVHIHSFTDMHDVGDALVRAYLADPVLDREELTVLHGSVDALLGDLRSVGVGNAATGRAVGMTGRGHWQRFRAELAAAGDAEGRIPLGYEVIYGLAWGTGIAPLQKNAAFGDNVP